MRLSRQYNKKRQIIGGLSMKKMLRNKKGFSLIELLIVIAIMGVLAVIAFSMFSGVVANSRKKADVTQAGNIQKALVAYMVDTGDAECKSLKNNTTVIGGTLTADGAVSGVDWEDVVLALQSEQTVKSVTYKPYLNSKESSTPSTKEFGVQWTGHVGYYIKIQEDRMNAYVVPATRAASNIVYVDLE